MTQNNQSLYDNVCQHARRSALLGSINSVLGWDERTMMPTAGSEHRAEQMTLLSGMIHERWMDETFGRWLDELTETPLAADTHGDLGATVRHLKRVRDKKAKIPQSLVEELTRARILGQNIWQRARENDDFNAFRPMLEKIVSLKRQEAQALGYRDCAYDALLDDYEPDETTANVSRVLTELRDALIPLLDRIRASDRQPDASIFARSFPVDRQASFGRHAAAAIGFDFDHGRLDITAHPFCSGLGPNDCRITTRYGEHNFGDAFFSILHEAGHGMYEQGLRTDEYGLPLGNSVSMGIHESQSRMWENLVGRSRAFWDFFYPKAREAFPDALSDVSLDAFYFAVNRVRPSLIRTESDEITYNLHILIRFELEQALLDDDLPIADLPAAWNEKYRTYLGIEPPNDADGVLQDIHWSFGGIGYFPTYTLGNLYAAQFFAQADTDLNGLAQQFAKGEFTPLRDWLREKIHLQGKRYSAAELVQRITGSPLSHEPLIEHLQTKFNPLYG